ncbi:hypothetical protein ACFXPT_38180 [Streptomyces goshikiensis]|uniref:hypothetical protein n=1 Tax=Streptomyces goshikiensis TaxID=1942 RepID=UPI003675BABC
MATADDAFPIVEGTVIGLDINRVWQAHLRRFDIEHTFHLFQTDHRLDLPEDPHARGSGPLVLAAPNCDWPGHSGSAGLCLTP